jgi:hypothetical protein
MGLNLRSKIFFDNKEVVKGTKESKEAVKEFTKTSEGFIDQFAGVFGVSMGQIGGSVKALQGGIISLSGAQKTATASTGLFSGALKILKFALAATGIGLLIVALGSLVAYFKSSQDGADKLARMMEPLKLAFALVTDAAAAIGRAIVGAFESPKEAISKLWDFIKNQFVNRLMGLTGVLKGFGNLLISIFSFDKTGINNALKDISDQTKQSLTGLNAQQRQNVLDSIKGTKEELAAKLDASNKLMIREQKLEKDRIEFIKRRADLEAAIAKQREIAANVEEYNAEQRLTAQNKAIDLTRALYSEEAKLAKELLDTTTIRDDLAENMNSDNENAANAYRNLINLQTQQSDALKSLFKRQATLTAEVEKERSVREKTAGLLLKINDTLPKLPTIEQPVVKVDLEFPTAEEVRAKAGGIKEVTAELETQFLDFSNIIGSGLSSLGEALGELFASGDIEGFADNLLATFGGLIKQLGQMVLNLGIGLLAATTALKSLNPFIAIAAGTALIALGSIFAKSTQQLGNSISSGSGAVSGGVVNTVPTASNMERQTLQVVVSGELKARGNTLVGVIANENNRRRLAT